MVRTYSRRTEWLSPFRTGSCFSVVDHFVYNVQTKDIYQDMKRTFFILLTISLCFSQTEPYVVVLGIAQDGGMPHAGCEKTCCKDLWNPPEIQLKVSSIAIIDPDTKRAWMIDATPDFPTQLYSITNKYKSELKGIFLTHGHIGHYTGLMHLGREVMGANSMPVYAMPRMKVFLENNGPWDQLVSLKNIQIVPIQPDKSVKLTNQISITPFLVPHRDEYTETVGYRIDGPKRSMIYIPDIDKWNKWETDIVDLVSDVDYALLDGTFYDGDEIPNREMSEIPHPFIIETMDRFSNSELSEKKKINFIHLNHSNPALSKLDVKELILNQGFQISDERQKFTL